VERWEGGEKKKGGGTQQERVFPLSTCRVYPCVSAAGAAPREFNSIFNLPKPLYANSGYRRRVFLDFFLPFPRASRLTLSLSSSPGSHPSARPLLFVLLRGTDEFSSIRARRAKAGTRFRHFLPPFTNVASRIFGTVLNKAAEKLKRQRNRPYIDSRLALIVFHAQREGERERERTPLEDLHFKRPLGVQFSRPRISASWPLS